ncbi:MAG: DUF418 domain-containing protein [Marinifilaceae bacterium]
MEKSYSQPLRLNERIEVLDVLRGFALLGILILNILFFALPFSSFSNPTVFGDLTGLNLRVFQFTHIFGEMKFMSLFSILFGAGVLLFIHRLDGKGLTGTQFHVRRMWWLLLFGLIHAYLLWFGDILVAYSIVGFLVYMLRNSSNRLLIWLFCLFFFIPVIIFYLLGTAMNYAPDSVYQEALKEWRPSFEVLSREVDIYQNGSWWDIFMKRIPLTIQLQVVGFMLMSFWRIVSMMILGMLLFRNGILTGQKSKQFYLVLAIAGISIGTLISGYGLHLDFEKNWDLAHFYRIGTTINYMASLPMALGYLGLVLWVYQMKIADFLMKGLAAVGRMAFTNYLCQTVICSLLFYSYGFGLFGKLQRVELLGIVLIIWMFQIGFSWFWLREYNMGPLEWLWRWLTYREKPRFRSKKKVKLA